METTKICGEIGAELRGDTEIKLMFQCDFVETEERVFSC